MKGVILNEESILQTFTLGDEGISSHCNDPCSAVGERGMFLLPASTRCAREAFERINVKKFNTKEGKDVKS